jgi:Cytosol aminopeptidase family, N-terminal domain
MEKMQINLSTEAPDLLERKCLVLGVFSDERPPRGICGFIDWRLNGFISREIKQGRIIGELMEKVAIPFPQRIGSKILILFGLGNLSDINYDRIYSAAYSIAGVVDGMLIRDYAFDLPGENRSGLTSAGIVEAMITGFFDYLSNDVDKLANMSSCIVTSPSNVKDVSLGIKNFKSNIKDMGSVDVSALESDSPALSD